MGGCISVDKVPESATKLQISIESKNEKLLILSPVKAKPPEKIAGGRQTIADVALRFQSSPAVRDSDSKEETFFDSKPWLESDCEEDFYSVNGDFTPSRGNTPVHHNFSTRVNPIESTTPPKKRKKLSELFRESFQGSDQDVDDQNAANDENQVVEKMELSSKSSKWSIYVPRAKEKSIYSTQSCLPRFLSTRN